VVAGRRAPDRPPNQTTAPERQWRKHVLAVVAADLSLGGWSIVRRLLRETPYPCRHPIPPRSYRKPRLSRSPSRARQLGRRVSPTRPEPRAGVGASDSVVANRLEQMPFGRSEGVPSAPRARTTERRSLDFLERARRLRVHASGARPRITCVPERRRGSVAASSSDTRRNRATAVSRAAIAVRARHLSPSGLSH
jgi:hypothetical protein